ncbi:hypothetical protein [Buttiauxella gaviniae]|uniref:hypothetical protein n=1 Tax=Buttiauxella gaviniae TaxID=82990 RepID=UPI003C7816F9
MQKENELIQTVNEVNSLLFKAVEVETYPDFLSACISEECVILSKGEYSIGNVTIPASAKLKTLIIQNSLLRLTDYNLKFERTSDLVIDLSHNGVIHLGLKKALVVEDAGPGVNKIIVDDASVFSVGEHLTTSIMAVTNSKWANAIRVSGDAFNSIRAIDGNVLTMQYGVDPGRVLYKNAYLGNAKFSEAGLSFKGKGKVTIIGGEIKESRAGYYASVYGDIQLFCDNTHFSGQFLDGFLMSDNSSIYFNKGSIIGSYDPSKQTVVWDSSGDLTFDGVKVHRGNFDQDIYHSKMGFKHGALRIINGCQFDGESLLPLKPSQPDTVLGGIVGDHLTYLTDSLHVHALNFGEYGELRYQDSTFKNYRRALTGTDYLGASANCSIDSIFIKDVEMSCSPFYFKKNSFDYNVGVLEINDISVTRGWGGNFYPLGYTSLMTPVVFGGHTKLYPNNINDNHNISDQFVFNYLEFVGAGEVKLPSSTQVSKVIVNGSSLIMSGTTLTCQFTEVVLLNGGTINNNPFRKYISSIQMYWSKGSKTFSTIKSLPLSSNATYVGTLMLSPVKLYPETSGIAGHIAFNLNEGAQDVIVSTEAGDLEDNSAKWLSTPIGIGASANTITVKLKIVSGVLQMNISSTRDVGINAILI